MKHHATLCMGAICSVLLLITVSGAEILRCPGIFSDHMVLQRHQSVPVWGWASPGADVTVGFAGQTKSAKANPGGRWRLSLDRMEASAEGRSFTVSSGNTKLTYENVVVGEVWLASGQSNMKWPLAKSSMPVDVLSKLSRPQIRIFDVPETTSLLPVADLPENWKVLTPETAPAASAVACYFAMKLQDELDVPVGMFCAAWNASHIEPWTAVAGFDEIPETKRFADKARSKAPDAAAMKAYLSNVKSWIVETEHALDEGANVTAMPLLPRYNSGLSAPAAMFNGMIHPLAGYAMRGAIWYQGESNIGDKGSYEAKLRALIAGWRKAWGQGAFPFYFVQLPPYAYDGIGEFWEAQFHVSRSVENVGMAVTTDIGEMNNLHPANKKDVGERLALWALAKDYGRKLVYSGPLYKGYEIKGNTMVVAFDHAESGLACKGEEVTDVFIKGEGDASFVKALAKMEGSKLIIGHPDGRKPLHVRMGWNKNALPNLMNKEGLPASPFRTDQDE